MRILLALLAVAALAPPLHAADARIVVVSTNPLGTPSAGTQFLLGIQVTGLSEPSFLGTNLVTLSGNIGNSDAPAAFAAQPASFYHGPNVLFQSEANLSNTIDSVNYKRTGDSFFASPWRSLLSFGSGGAGETANSLFIDAGLSGAFPSQVPGNGTYPFAYVNVSAAPGVQIKGTFALGVESAPIGGGHGLLLAPGGTLSRLGLGSDFNLDNAVTGADLTIFKSSFAASTDGDADEDGDTDGADFLFLQRQLGRSVVTAAANAVPEPSSIGLVFLGMLAVGRKIRARS